MRGFNNKRKNVRKYFTEFGLKYKINRPYIYPMSKSKHARDLANYAFGEFLDLMEYPEEEFSHAYDYGMQLIFHAKYAYDSYFYPDNVVRQRAIKHYVKMTNNYKKGMK